MSAPVAAADTGACPVNASDAVVSLPSPLNKWAEIICTPYGQVITGHNGWVWIEPVNRALVVIPSGTLDTEPPPTAVSKAYFTKVEMTKIEGEEFEKAWAKFHADFKSSDAKPTGYKLVLSTASGDGLQLYFFDHKTYGWGISCPYGTCDTSSRFVIVNIAPKPKPALPPAI
jgi:hypothetical protein